MVWVYGWVCDCASYLLHFDLYIVLLSTTNCYALVGRIPEEYGIVVVFVCVCVCVLFCSMLFSMTASN